MNRPGMQDADNKDVNANGPDEEPQTIQDIMQIWRILTKAYANVPI